MDWQNETEPGLVWPVLHLESLPLILIPFADEETKDLRGDEQRLDANPGVNDHCQSTLPA